METLTDSIRSRRRVVIVGAGPTGCSAAILLAQRGIESLVLERWPEAYTQPRAVHLDDEVYRILARMQVSEAFAAISRPSNGLQLVDRAQHVLGQFTRLPDASRNGYPQANMYDQPALEAILRKRMDALPHIAVRTRAEVTGVRANADGTATLTFIDLDTGAAEVVDAEFVLAADGANSVVRSAIGATLEPLGFEQRWLVIDAEVNADLGHWDGVHQLCDTRRAGTYMRIGETRHRWEFQLLPTESVNDYGTPEQLNPLLAPWLGATPVQQVAITRTAEYTFRAALADRWRVGPVFLLGDAAHLTPPFIGQGLGAGLRDADNLSWKIAGVITGQLDPGALDTYEAERRPHAQALIQLAKLVGITMTGGGRPGTVARRLLAPAMARFLGRFELTGRGATPPLNPSMFVLADHDKAAGRLVPNVTSNGPLDAQIGGRWALVTLVEVSPSVAEHLRDLGCAVVRTARDEHLGSWLLDLGRVAVLVRPDATVMASGTPAELAGALAGLLAPSAR